jgi:rubrerythrin
MSDATTLQNKLLYANKRVKYAWAQYYNTTTAMILDAHFNRDAYIRIVSDNAIPTHIKDELKSMADALKKKWECPICLDMIESNDLDITNCGHYYCKECLKSLIKTFSDAGKDKWDCSICKRKHKIKDD